LKSLKLILISFVFITVFTGCVGKVVVLPFKAVGAVVSGTGEVVGAVIP